LAASCKRFGAVTFGWAARSSSFFYNPFFEVVDFVILQEALLVIEQQGVMAFDAGTRK
jgi:hypothetical protein